MWKQYTTSLKHCAIKLKDEEDVVIWSKNRARRIYITKMGYEVKVNREEYEQKWWWKVIWKLNCLLKTHYLCLSLANKVLTLLISQYHICFLFMIIFMQINQLFL